MILIIKRPRWIYTLLQLILEGTIHKFFFFPFIFLLRIFIQDLHFFLSNCQYILKSKVIMLVNQQVYKHVQDIQEQKRKQTLIIITKERTC